MDQETQEEIMKKYRTIEETQGDETAYVIEVQTPRWWDSTWYYVVRKGDLQEAREWMKYLEQRQLPVTRKVVS